MSVIIGYTPDGQPITIGDEERRAGMYVLGKSGTGKSTLFTNMIAQDIKNGHGVFFLDPHGVAIDELLACSDRDRLSSDALLLDPQDEKASFGINLLACKNIHSMNARTDTYTRAYGVFTKLWEDSEQEMGPWLQSIIENILYIFIENQEYTMAEMPLFLRNEEFRNKLLNNVRYNYEAVDYWRYEFSERQAQPFITRLRMLLSHPHVKHIISQKQTTINFQEIMKEKKILLVKLSFTLPSDIKKFIGTILLSELTHAALTREDRTHFCIYVDEVQNFATSEDFATLFTQARKFFISTVISHQERYGQFADNKKMQGATAAAVNKIFFQTTVRDAEELAAEFAVKPPTERRREQELVISREPVWDLLSRGHANPEIQEFVSRYLLPWREKIQQIKEEIERTQLVRMDFQDQATLYRDAASIYGVDDKREGIYASMVRGRDISVSRSALSSMEGAFAGAMHAHQGVNAQTAGLMALHNQFADYRHRITRTDKLLIGIMEGRFAPAFQTEASPQFLYDIICDSLPESDRKIALLSFHLSFGDPKLPRVIPSIFAVKHWPKQLEDAYLNGRYKEVTDHYTKQRLANIKQKRDVNPERYTNGIQYHSQRIRDHYRATDIIYKDGQPAITPEPPVGLWKEEDAKYLIGAWIPLPDLPPRVLTPEEIEKVNDMCSVELYERNKSQYLAIIATIHDVINFRNLLREPENHIKVPSGQYVHNAVNSRTVADMTHEMGQELIDLPRFTAYAKLIRETGRGQSVFKGLIQTLPLPESAPGRRLSPHALLTVINLHTANKAYIRLRGQIENELRQRKTAWRDDPPEPPSHLEDPPPTSV